MKVFENTWSISSSDDEVIEGCFSKGCGVQAA